MGLGLSLLPLDLGSAWIEGKAYATASTCLTFEKESILIGYILEKSEIHSISIPPLVLIRCWIPCLFMKTISKDGLGEKLTYMNAYDLWELRLPANATRKEIAIGAFIDGLSFDTRIVLYWH